MFADDRYPRVNNPRYHAEPPTIEDDVAVGMGVVVLPGVTLGRGCVIGAGAVVTFDVPPYMTVVGNPARKIRRACDDLEDPVSGEPLSLQGH
jgi:maltose O-acetyltransferase